MNEITPTRPSKVKKSKIRPKLKPIVSPTDDNYDDEGFGLGYGEWTPSKRRQQSPENDTPKDDEKKDERCDTLKLQSESSNEEIRTDNAMSNASDDISLTRTQLSFDNKLKLSKRDVTNNEKDNRANDCVSQVTFSQKKLNEGNKKSKCVDDVWIESTCSLLRSRVWHGFIILLCITAICEVICISIVIKCRLSHVESSNISDTSALDKELSYVDYMEESSSGNNNISETGRDVLTVTETVEETVENETTSLLDEEIQDESEIKVKDMGSEEVTTPVKGDTESNASQIDELVKEVEHEEGVVPSLLGETQDAPEIEKQFRAGQEAPSALEEEVTQDAPRIEIDNDKTPSPLVEERSKIERINLGREGEEAHDQSGIRHEKHKEGEVVSQTQAVHLKNEQVELEPVPDVAIEDNNQDITTLQIEESLPLSEEGDQGVVSTESDEDIDAETTLNLLRDEEPKMKLGMNSDISMVPVGDEQLESDSDELSESNFVEVDLEASDELADTSFAESKEIKGVNKPLPNINAPENVESHEQDYANPKLIGVEKDEADTNGSQSENEHELHKVRPLTKETKREFLAKLNQFEDAFESYEVIDALIGHVACAVPKLLLKRVLGLFTKVTFSTKK